MLLAYPLGNQPHLIRRGKWDASHSTSIPMHDLAERLRRHVETLAARERNADLETPARYIESALGPGCRRHSYPSAGRTVCNLELGDGPIVVGAHYDTVPGSPGADDNASGVA